MAQFARSKAAGSVFILRRFRVAEHVCAGRRTPERPAGAPVLAQTPVSAVVASWSRNPADRRPSNDRSDACHAS